MFRDNKIVSTGVTDVKGRYRLEAKDRGEYIMEVKATGYKRYIKKIIINEEKIDRDIGLIKEGESKGIKGWYRNNKDRIYRIMKIINLFILLLGLGYTVYAFTISKIIINYVFLILYIIMIVTNIYLMIHREVEMTRIIDKVTGKGIVGASVRLYNNDRQILVAISDENGRVRVDIKEGRYYIRVDKDGYNTYENGNIEVDKSGRIKDEIKLIPNIL